MLLICNKAAEMLLAPEFNGKNGEIKVYVLRQP